MRGASRRSRKRLQRIKIRENTPIEVWLGFALVVLGMIVFITYKLQHP